MDQDLMLDLEWKTYGQGEFHKQCVNSSHARRAFSICLKEHIDNVIRDAVLRADCKHRNVVEKKDVKKAVKKINI